MNEAEMSQYIIDAFEGVDVVDNSGNSFFFYNPDTLPPDHMFPFATLMTNDLNDPFSNLDRPTVYRLNIGLSKQTFQSMFGTPNLPSNKDGSPKNGNVVTDFDFTALDQVMPHPVYGGQYWVCVLNPTRETLEVKVQPLLNEAYQRAVTKRKR
jgi:hypothetical protein